MAAGAPTRLAFAPPAAAAAVGAVRGAATAAAATRLSWVCGGVRLGAATGGAARTAPASRRRLSPAGGGVRGLRGAAATGAVDMRWVKENVGVVKANAAARCVAVDVDRAVSLYDAYIALVTETDDTRRQRNEVANRMKTEAAKMAPDVRTAVVAEGKALKASVTALEGRLAAAEAAFLAEAAKLPNLTHPDVPTGGEEAATTLRTVGAARDFAADGMAPRSHVDIGADLDLFDFEAAARVAGNKFYYLKNAGALLELALVNWSMAHVAARGFTPMTAPDVAREEVVAGCGFAPRGEASQVYRLAESDLCLVGTAEIPLGGMYAGQVLAPSALPLRLAAFSHCFRREVGAAGTATRGLYRVHQFSKVELFVIGRPEDSDALHAELLALEEEMYTALGLHYRVLDMPSGDLGNPAYRKFDIEAWMPGRGDGGGWGEISSASNCTDFQARRLGIRYREEVAAANGDADADSRGSSGSVGSAAKGAMRYAHTLNATACAVPRMMVAILENNVQPDGSVVVPEVLRPFMGGMEAIRPR